jgi:AcrR family transcriptional regulator
VNNVNIPRRSSYHHGNLREALVKAALRAIAEDGPESFTLRHFKDKDELFAAVAAECAGRLFAMVEAAIAEPSHDALDQFRNIGIAMVQFAAAHPEHFRALTSPDISDRLPGKADSWNSRQRELLAAGQAAGQIAAVPLDDLLLAANSLVLGLGHLIVGGQLGEVSPERARELAIAATGILGLGLLPR